MVGMMGSQQHRSGSVPSEVLIEIARDPDGFEERIEQYHKARDASLDAAAKTATMQAELKAEEKRFRAEEAETNRRIAAERADLGAWAKALDEREAKLIAAQNSLLDQGKDLKAERKAFEAERSEHAAMVASADERLAVAVADIKERRVTLSAEETVSAALVKHLNARRAQLAEINAAIHSYLSSGA